MTLKFDTILFRVNALCVKRFADCIKFNARKLLSRQSSFDSVKLELLKPKSGNNLDSLSFLSAKKKVNKIVRIIAYCDERVYSTNIESFC